MIVVSPQKDSFKAHAIALPGHARVNNIPGQHDICKGHANSVKKMLLSSFITECKPLGTHLLGVCVEPGAAQRRLRGADQSSCIYKIRLRYRMLFMRCSFIFRHLTHQVLLSRKHYP